MSALKRRAIFRMRYRQRTSGSGDCGEYSRAVGGHMQNYCYCCGNIGGQRSKDFLQRLHGTRRAADYHKVTIGHEAPRAPNPKLAGRL